MYQVTVFLSRSSISLGFPPLPERLLPGLAVIQLVILLTLVYESAIGIFGDSSEGASFFLVFFLISIEGTCGGLALYVVASHFSHPPRLISSVFFLFFSQASTRSIGLTMRSRILRTLRQRSRRKSSRSVPSESQIRAGSSWPFCCRCLSN